MSLPSFFTDASGKTWVKPKRPPRGISLFISIFKNERKRKLYPYMVKFYKTNIRKPDETFNQFISRVFHMYRAAHSNEYDAIQEYYRSTTDDYSKEYGKYKSAYKNHMKDSMKDMPVPIPVHPVPVGVTRKKPAQKEPTSLSHDLEMACACIVAAGHLGIGSEDIRNHVIDTALSIAPNPDDSLKTKLVIIASTHRDLNRFDVDFMRFVFNGNISIDSSKQ